MTHVSNPLLETRRLLRSQGGVDCLPGHLSGPLVIRAMQHRRVGLASASWVPAAVEAESDGSAESQPGVRKFGQ